MQVTVTKCSRGALVPVEKKKKPCVGHRDYVRPHLPVPEYLEEIRQYYNSIENVTLDMVEREHVEAVFDAYGRDILLDVMNIAEIFNISANKFYSWLRRDQELQDMYNAVKSRRAHSAMVTGYNILEDTYMATIDGSASKERVAAAKAFSSYLMSYSQSLNPENKKAENNNRAINISLALPSTPFNTGYVEVTADDDDE